MKKILTVFVLAALLLGLLPTAIAEEASPLSFSARDAALNRLTGALAILDPDESCYRLLDAEGNELVSRSEGYTALSPVSGYPFFKTEVDSADGLHRKGLIDSAGRVLVPAQYADVDIISARWQAGILLTPSNADDKDYTVTNFSTGDKSFYRILAADIFFDGELVGTLDRSAYGGGSCNAYGAYLCVRNMESERIFYNSRLEPSPRAAEYSGEFDTVYKNGSTTVYHQGSGQVAFVPECTLDPADLENPYFYDRGVLYDIRGNEAFTPPQNYESIRSFYDGYARVRMNGYYGLVSEQGEEVIPPVYDDLGNSEEHPLRFGYISAVKDGKFGFLDGQGAVSCDFVYAADIVSNRTTFATIKNLDGSIIVLSAAVGELSEHFADVSFPAYDGCAAFVGENGERQLCVVDLYGNTLLPYGDYRDITLSVDGSVALVSLGSREYQLYRFAVNPPAPGSSGSKAAPAEEGWTCENGHSGNQGNFCSECGAARPAENICSSCGFDFGETTPKFCPNCGQPVG